ncbi:FCP1 likey domain-containing protein [Spatholobus suberectus]|nr:FCP1 likey domain-containing protein [Spatholobus suberectus]
MAGKNKTYNFYNISDSEDDYEAQDKEKELDLPLEKLNLGPKKKLLVMNLNGLLLHRTNRGNKGEIPRSRRPDWRSGNYLAFKRPSSEEFMKFCLERFEVGIWSSAKEHNFDAALNCAIGALKSKLLFVWDQDQCTNSGFRSLENKFKPLFFKELNKVWDNVKKGCPYSASNTLLIDDKPYKAFLNPDNTSIFPEPYKPEDEADNALDPKGELCSYLEGLAEGSDVQSYVRDHPFGQPAITSSHPDWGFYSEVKECLCNKGN